MKTKLSLIALALITVSCATNMRCPACRDTGDFNGVLDEKLDEKLVEFVYTNNNKAAVKQYRVPVVVEKSYRWECSNGHRISVAK